MQDSWHGCKGLDGGTLFTQFSHFVDIMYWLFGDIVNVRSTMRSFNHQHLTDFEDSGVVNFEFEHGGLGSIVFTTSVWDQNLESSMTIVAENGSVKVGGQYMNEVEYCHVKDYEMPNLEPTNPANDYGHYKGSAANHHYVIGNVIDVLNNRRSITTNAMEGMKVVEIIEKMYANAAVSDPSELEHPAISQKKVEDRIQLYARSADRINNVRYSASEKVTS
jgi:predicted dehydrogenase